jgi:multidrug efflux pump subunit AcrA (membrane-fusion protein)
MERSMANAVTFGSLSPALAVALALSIAPASAADKVGPGSYAGAAVTVVKARKGCFSDTISVSGMIVPRDEVPVRPDREGHKVAELLVEVGDTVTSGQALARLTPPEGAANAAVIVPAPVAGIVLKAEAVIGQTASARAAPMFRIVARGEFELLGELAASQLAKLSLGLPARIAAVGVGEVKGVVRSLPATVDGATQLGHVHIFIGSDPRLRVGAFGRAQLVVAQSCNLAIPLSAVLYSGDTAVVAVVRSNRIETRQVDVGQLSEGEAEIRSGLAEGDLVVAKAGAFVREGDRVRPFLDGAPVVQK